VERLELPIVLGLCAQSLKKQFRSAGTNSVGTILVDGINLSIDKEEFVAITRASRCGRSPFLDSSETRRLDILESISSE